MDPNATLLRLLQAIEDHEWSEAREALGYLEHWVSRGGFQPPALAAAMAAIRLIDRKRVSQ